jgi:hypothetical protein|nr:MAG TPA: Nucleotide modification associated domain 1 [Caudoviricetes sp.]
MDKVQFHKFICNHLNEIYRKKNADYGDSFAKVRELVPNAIIVRLMDKMERIKTLTKNGEQAQVEDEKIEDTLADMANYCIMELVERQAEKEAKNGQSV